MQKIFDQIWHGFLKQPYTLAKHYDKGSGQGIVLLHGLGRTGMVWKEVSRQLAEENHSTRVVTYDLLGFGTSPKPDRIQYNVDDHANAVIHQIKQLRGSKPVIIVGHSMGSLVAVRIARLRPDLVRHLVLYEMPLYEGLPEKWRYKARINMYFSFYEWVSKQNPSFNAAKKKLHEKITTRVVGTDITAETLGPFVKSLKNTIMKQSAAKDLPQLKMPADIIYGSRDMLVIRGKVQEILGLDSSLVTLHTIKESHVISPQASRFIVSRIKVALDR